MCLVFNPFVLLLFLVCFSMRTSGTHWRGYFRQIAGNDSKFSSNHNTEKLRGPNFSWIVINHICVRLFNTTFDSSEDLSLDPVFLKSVATSF